MKHLFILLLLLAGSASSFAQLSPNAIQQAMHNYEYEKVLSLIAQEELPAPALLLQKALALKGLNRFYEAADALREVIGEEPENQKALIELALCCRQAGLFEESLTCFQQILEKEPGNKFIQIQSINLLCTTEQYKEAHQACSKLLESDSTAVPLRLMGNIHSALSNPKEAIDNYEKVLQLEPHDSFSAARLASLFIQLNDPESAIEVTEKYREHDTKNTNVNRQNAQAYSLNKDYDTAIDRYEYLVSQGDSSAMTCYYLGMGYYIKERYYDAHTFLSKAYEYSPKNINILYYLAKTCARTSWKKEGVELMNEAISLTIPSDSTLTTLYAGLAECYKMAGEPKKTIETIAEQYKYDNTNHILLYTIASIYQDHLKDKKNAEIYLKRFLKTKPKETQEESIEEENGTIVLGKRNYYKAAEKRLEDIRLENFFQGELPAAE